MLEATRRRAPARLQLQRVAVWLDIQGVASTQNPVFPINTELGLRLKRGGRDGLEFT